MITNDQNPFDPNVLARGETFCPRPEDASWLLSQMLRPGAFGLTSAPGAGASSLLEQAGGELMQNQRVLVMRLDLSLMRSPTDLATSLDGVARQLRGASASFFSSDMQRGLAAVVPRSLAMLQGSSGDDLAAEQAIGAAVRSIDLLAAARGAKLAMVFDSASHLGRFGGPGLERVLGDSVRQATRTAYGFAGYGAHPEKTNSAFSWIGAERVRELGAVGELGSFIDAKFSARGVISASAGKACVELAAGNTRLAIALARQSWSLSLQLGRVERTDVERSFGVLAEQHREAHLRSWNNLSTEERSTLCAIARSGVGSSAGSGQTASFRKTTIEELWRKRLITLPKEGQPVVSSALFRHFALSATFQRETLTNRLAKPIVVRPAAASSGARAGVRL